MPKNKQTHQRRAAIADLPKKENSKAVDIEKADIPKSKHDPLSHHREKLYPTPEDMAPMIDKYFNWADKNKYPYIFEDLCLFLGMCEDTWYEYSKKSSFSELVRITKLRVKADRARALTHADCKNIRGQEFWLRNHASDTYKSEQNLNIGGQQGNPIVTQQMEVLSKLPKHLRDMMIEEMEKDVDDPE
jgi:hypothetical protein